MHGLAYGGIGIVFGLLALRWFHVLCSLKTPALSTSDSLRRRDSVAGVTLTAKDFAFPKEEGLGITPSLTVALPHE